MDSSFTRRGFLKSVAAGAAARVTQEARSAGGAGSQKRPHIVLYISNDHGLGFVGCYGNSDVRTPHIDAPAREGTLFTDTTDQGSEWPHSKWTLYDAGLHVPFLAVWPGVTKPSSTCDALISFIDVTPTFIDTAGGEPPQSLDGKSFPAVLAGRETSFRDAIYASHTRDGDMNIFPQRCVRDVRYKYLVNLTPDSTWTTHWSKVSGIPESHKEVWDTWVEKARTDPQAARIVRLNEHHPWEELYDTQTDPYEFNNLANDLARQPILLKLRRQLAQWLTEQGETMPGPLERPTA